MAPLPRSRPITRASTVVLALGSLSAAALLGTSLLDFGDPRIEARAAAQAAAASRATELQLRWTAMRGADAAPAGAGTILRASDAGGIARRDLALPTEQNDPVFELLLDSGLGALDRGQLSEALTYLTDALDEPGADVAGRRPEALYAAARAASALGESGSLSTLRSELLARPVDTLLEGTSVQLLSTLLEPEQLDSAEALLKATTDHLPPPKDLALVAGGYVKVQLDPWWSAVRSRLVELDPTRPWDALLHRDERRAEALRLLLDSRGANSTDAWTITDIQGALLGHRLANGVLEIAPVEETVLLAALAPELPSSPNTANLTRWSGESFDAAPLFGSPFALSVTPTDPERSARPQLRRIRALRIGLVALAALVALATFLSSRAMARARRLTELRSTFVASVSHDLRTPTQAILLLAETLEEDLVKTPGARRQYHTQIRREAQRLRRLVEDLLDGARIDRGGGARVERRLVEAEPFFDELQRNMEERASAAKASLCFERVQLPQTLHVDPDGVHRAIWNLFENALLHGHSGKHRAEVTVTVAFESDVLTCTVEDSGPGIPGKYRETVFGAFERLGDRDQAAGIEGDTGTGLGLSIVRALARAHGGDAALSPEPEAGQGARFVVTFQTQETANPAEGSPEA